MTEGYKAVQNRNEESPLVEHEIKCHNNQKASWAMSAICFPKGNLRRQAMEGQLITKSSLVNNNLNRKREWGQNLPPRLEIDDQSGRGRKRRARNSPAREMPRPPPPPPVHQGLRAHQPEK